MLKEGKIKSLEKAKTEKKSAENSNGEILKSSTDSEKSNSDSNK